MNEEIRKMSRGYEQHPAVRKLIDHAEQLQSRIDMALMMSATNFPGFISNALKGEPIPKSILKLAKMMVEDEDNEH